MNKIILVLLLMLNASISFAQEEGAKNPSPTKQDSSKTDSIQSIVPGYSKKVNHEKLDSLSDFELDLTKKNCPNTVKGYRVQIFSCSGADCQEKAEQFYNQFVVAFPDIPAYRLWDPPSLKVRVGNCRNRFEAEAIKNQIKEDFPFLFIVSDFIESPYQVDCLAED